MSERTITITLTKDDLNTIRGWANYVRFSSNPFESTWDAEDERVNTKMYEAINPFYAPCLADKLDPVSA